MSSRFWFLLARKLAGEATLDEIRELEQLLLENPELAGRVELYTKYFNSRIPTAPSANARLEQQWQQQLDRLRGQGAPEDQVGPPDSKPLKKGRMLNPVLVFGLVALVAGLFGIFTVKQRQGALLPGNTPGAVTSKNERIETLLPDGSKVWLNKDSRLTFDKGFGKSNREIYLTGEAFFDVVHKAELPMIVHAGKVDVMVKGTAFNVCAYPGDNQVETALVRGSIELSARINGKKQRLLMKPNEKVTVHTGETPVQLRQQAPVPEFVLDTLAVEEQSGLIPEIAWIQNKMVFKNENFAELTEKMNKWFHARIIIEDTSLLKERFTGVFQNENLQEALEALRFTYGFNYSIQNNQVVITK
ncbi:hypothetical protein A8C56_01045 [Niabella ginsenosidivorans]|uniref:Iron dicitrate transport regulator FecR n=1 Tax=Niabella ginsenosidivorans TaxID=1176587 RepID=A0A1A9HWI3_9BACT|nr:FecR domain-containing protein [Niabella ginsenosidivorans]ANH79747.1 hypothetical protein A8C56_01045 [Niabella ginsenosidivorans]